MCESDKMEHKKLTSVVCIREQCFCQGVAVVGGGNEGPLRWITEVLEWMPKQNGDFRWAPFTRGRKQLDGGCYKD